MFVYGCIYICLYMYWCIYRSLLYIATYIAFETSVSFLSISFSVFIVITTELRKVTGKVFQLLQQNCTTNSQNLDSGSSIVSWRLPIATLVPVKNNLLIPCKVFSSICLKNKKKYYELNQWQPRINYTRNWIVTKRSKWIQKSLQFIKLKRKNWRENKSYWIEQCGVLKEKVKDVINTKLIQTTWRVS